jgi:hypothetical protein
MNLLQASWIKHMSVDESSVTDEWNKFAAAFARERCDTAL